MRVDAVEAEAHRVEREVGGPRPLPVLEACAQLLEILGIDRQAPFHADRRRVAPSSPGCFGDDRLGLLEAVARL